MTIVAMDEPKGGGGKEEAVAQTPLLLADDSSVDAAAVAREAKDGLDKGNGRELSSLSLPVSTLSKSRLSLFSASLFFRVFESNGCQQVDY